MSQVTDSASTERHKLPVRTLVAASIGNAVEWFDWTIYATFAVYFSSQFFDSSSPTLALIGTTSTYALAFFFRDRKSTRLNSSHSGESRMPSSA